MKFLKFSLVFLLSIQVLSAQVTIQPYRAHFSWKEDWSEVISGQLKNEEYFIGDNALLNIVLDEENLDELKCDGYNQASISEKTDFWIVFFSALARAESAFNPKAMSAKTRGHRSFGLLQLAKATAQSRCGIIPPKHSVLNAEDNLTCGIKLMTWQLQGAPVKSGKKMRADLEGQLFGKNIFQWGPLRRDDHKGRTLLVNWFKSHLDQMKFCQGHKE